MNIESLKISLIESLKTEVDIRKRGINDYRVNVPFCFSDGDSPKIILKETSEGNWMLTDEGHTSMYLSYHGIELNNSDSRTQVTEKILSSHFIENRAGRLIMPNICIEDIASALFTFTQGVMKIADMTLWKRERSKNMFLENFKRTIPEIIGKRRYNFDYHYPRMESYVIDCLITNSHGQHFIFMRLIPTLKPKNL